MEKKRIFNDWTLKMEFISARDRIFNISTGQAQVKILENYISRVK